MKNPKERFSDRVEDYKRYRPSYPSEALQYVKEQCKVSPDWKVADIGSGTGISTKAIMDSFLCSVYAVEPNEKMRLEAEESLAGDPLFHSVNGSSEATNLPDQSMHMITAFQAFHWFDKKVTKTEFQRVLTDPAWVLLAWNDRKTEGTDFLEGYERLLRLLPEYAKTNHKNTGRSEIENFLGCSNVIYAEFVNTQKFDFDGFKGRYCSSSYTPPCGSNEYATQINQLVKLFENTSSNGVVEFAYTTQIYLGKIKRGAATNAI